MEYSASESRTTESIDTLPLATSGERRAGAAPADRRAGEPMVHDPMMRQLYAMIDLFAPTPLNVLVQGEAGVGKALYAAAIHARSGRSAKPYRELDCTAPEAILEAELFGYERGAFAGAAEARPGLLEAADGGTVVLDEISELPAATQARLLHVLESGSVRRLGGLTAVRVDVRFIAVTHRDLRALVADGKFRAELYFRLNGTTIMLPALRDRRADIAPLARAFVARTAAALGREVPALSPDAVAALERHSWPGNVRELERVIDRAVAWRSGDVIGRSELELADKAFAPRRLREAAPELAARAPSDGAALGDVRSLGRNRILDALAEAAGNQTRAARALGISRFQLMRRLEALGVPRPRKA